MEECQPGQLELVTTMILSRKVNFLHIPSISRTALIVFKALQTRDIVSSSFYYDTISMSLHRLLPLLYKNYASHPPKSAVVDLQST